MWSAAFVPPRRLPFGYAEWYKYPFGMLPNFPALRVDFFNPVLMVLVGAHS
jgi:hypothetical protein